MDKNEIKNTVQEPDTALAAGERALRSLYLAQEYFNSAGKSSMWEIFGGGFLSGAMKHSKVDEAKKRMTKAGDYMAKFRAALNAHDIHTEYGDDMGEFIKFADYFVAAAIADWAVQSRFSDAKVQLRIISGKMETVVARLRDEVG